MSRPYFKHVYQGKKMSLEILSKTKIDLLGDAAQFSIFAIRVWSSATYQKIPIEKALGGVFEDFCGLKVLDTFDECMSLMAVAALREVSIACCPSNEYVVGDEAAVLNCFRELECHNTHSAIDKMDGIILSALKPTFCTTAEPFVEQLNNSGLFFGSPNTLSLV